MAARRGRLKIHAGVNLADAFIRAVRAAKTPGELALIMEQVTSEIGFQNYALLHHADFRNSPGNLIDIRKYPKAIVERIIEKGEYRRDPVIRACAFAEVAFLWSEVDQIIRLNRYDRQCLENGRRIGLNEGITVPCFMLGDCMGSCTFAGMRQPASASLLIGPAQLIGVFAFQAARRLILGDHPLATPPRLHPRPRDCIVLAGRGLSNKEIARALSITPRTVDGYMTEARQLFDAHDRTELVVSAVFAGEIGLHELKRDQPA